MSTTAQGASPFYTAEHAAFRDLMRRFVAKEITPFVNEWDDAGSFPRELYNKAAEVGLLGLGFPEAYGGNDGDLFMTIIASQELARCGAGGVLASLLSHTIGCPPIVNVGSEALKQRVLPPVLRGEKISALGITEPSGGSDVANLKTTARREGDHYVVDGEKVFITSGMRADLLTVAVRTGEEGAVDTPDAMPARGAHGISLLVVPGDSPGLTRSPLQKMGWRCSDTAQLRFDGVRVPAQNLIGAPGEGFRMIMGNFNGERLAMAVAALGFSQACFDEALDWARQRRTFGRPLVEHQVIRHKLVDMQMRIQSTLAWVEVLSEQADAGAERVGGETSAQWVAQVCMLKNHATQTMQHCADQAVQILGGMGYMHGTRSERIYREVKVMMIGGGAEEIMKDLAARQLGL